MPHAPSAALSQRHAQIRLAMREASIDALVVIALPNIAYLTNFAGSSAIVVLTQEAVHFITDSRYTAAIAEMQESAWGCPALQLAMVDGSYDVTLSAVLKATGVTRAGVEAAHLTVSRFNWLQTALAGSTPVLVPVEGIIERARVVKDTFEVDCLRRAATMLSEVTRDVLAFAKAGMTERELALGIDTAVRRAGFERAAFETIVASGPNAALPHARPTNRRLGEGDLVVLDFGGVHDSYCVDLTRTVVVGSATERVSEVHDAVRRAHDAAIEAVAPGVSRFDIDAAARDVLTAAGMGAAFGHGTGHGLGLEVHEGPRVAKRGPNVDASDEAVKAGMVFTIEPGAYFPGWGGVRIEDDVLVTDRGVELLTKAPTELLII